MYNVEWNYFLAQSYSDQRGKEVGMYDVTWAKGGMEEVVATNDDLKITDRRTKEGSFGHADMVAAVFSNAARE